MPDYRVKTDQGDFKVTLDQPPSSMDELKDLVTKHMAGVPERAQVADNMAFDVNRAAQTGGSLMTARKEKDQVLTPQQLEQKTSPTGFAQQPQKTGAQVIETLNAPIEAAGNLAGHYVQSKVEPVLGGTASDIAGALTKEGLQFLGPQALSTGARLGAKALTKLLPGTQGGKVESLIDKTRAGLEGGLGRVQEAQKYSEGVVKNIPASDRAPLPNTTNVLDSIIAQDKAHGLNSPIRADAERIKGILETNPGQSLHWIDDELTHIGKKTKAVLGQEPPDQRYKQLFAAMATDLESTKPATITVMPKGQKPVTTLTPQPDKYNVPGYAPDQPIKQPPKSTTEYMPSGYPVKTEVVPSGKGQLVREKDMATRRALGWKEVLDEFNGMAKMKQGQAGATDINGAQLMNKLKSNQYLQDSLRPEDWQEITPLLTKLADKAALPPARGVSFGSGKAIARGSIAGLAGYMFGANPAVVAGAWTGIDYGVGHLMMTKGGRSLVKYVLESKAYEPSQQLNIINGMGRLAEKGINAMGDQPK